LADPLFLTLQHVLMLHSRQIHLFGGDAGILDIGLVESAVTQPRQGFGGEYFHKTLAEMAAAYLFHLVKNHGFADGNKRIGAAAALTFLEINGIDTDVIDDDEMETLTLAISTGSADKAVAARYFARYTHSAEQPPGDNST
jgi:death-on-curing protein